MENYYKEQLKKLNGRINVKFTSENGETNYLALNKECCRAIAETITELRDKKQIIVE